MRVAALLSRVTALEEAVPSIERKPMIFGYSVPEIRKALIACVAAVVTVCHAFGVPVAADLSTQAVSIFDAIAAVLVAVVPNATR